MSLRRILRKLFTAPRTDGMDMEGQESGVVWNQHARIMLAVVVVILSALVVAWILS